MALSALRKYQFVAHHTGGYRLLGEDVAPRANQHTVAPGAPAIFMQAALRRCDNKGLVFNRAGAQQQLPVILACGVGESAGHQQQIHPGLRIVTVQLRKTQVVADAHANSPALACAIGHVEMSRLVAAQQHPVFVKRLLAVVEFKQVHLVVPGHALAVGGESQTAVVDPAAGRFLRCSAACCVADGQRQGATHNPEVQCAGRLA